MAYDCKNRCHLHTDQVVFVLLPEFHHSVVLSNTAAGTSIQYIINPQLLKKYVSYFIT